jgi:uncharacterized membrane protein
LVFGDWLLVFGYWLLVFGDWLLVFGMIGFGCWFGFMKKHQRADGQP